MSGTVPIPRYHDRGWQCAGTTTTHVSTPSPTRLPVYSRPFRGIERMIDFEAGTTTQHGVTFRPIWEPWHDVPNGTTFAFVPVFSESRCGGDPESLAVGMDPACVRACPTEALVYGERRSDAIEALLERHEARGLEGPDATDLKENVTYIGLEGFEGQQLHRGAALDPRDPDPTYEQR